MLVFVVSLVLAVESVPLALHLGGTVGRFPLKRRPLKCGESGAQGGLIFCCGGALQGSKAFTYTLD